MMIQHFVDTLVMELDLSDFMIHFTHRLPPIEEVNSLKQYFLTKGDTPWNSSSFYDQVADKFYQQVIDHEQKNCLNTKRGNSSRIKVDLVEQDIPKLSYFDPSDAHDLENTTGKYQNRYQGRNTRHIPYCDVLLV
jgi:hypothetical protein